MKEHNFKSQVGSFSHENGHTNYSKCIECGIETDEHGHGDFAKMHELEDELNEIECKQVIRI